MYKDYIYTDELINSCYEYEFSESIWFIIGGIVIFIGTIIIISVICMLNYRSKYYQVLETKDNSKVTTSASII